ncbi:MAG: AI-2E family transporter [Candidatus Caldatribacteriota bacterium]
MELEKTKWVKLAYFLTLLALGLYLISPFLTPIIFGATISLALYPLHKKFLAKNISKKLSAGLLAFGFTFLISIPFTFFAARGSLIVSDQIQRLQRDSRFKEQEVSSIIKIVKGQITSWVETYSDKFGFPIQLTDDQFNVYAQKASNYLLTFFQNLATSLPTIFLFLLLMIISIYSFLKNSAAIRSFFQEILGLNDEKMNELSRKFINGSRQVYLTNLITGSVQSFVVALASSILGIFEFFLVFFITLILSFIPVIGAAPVAFVIGIYAFFQGEMIQAIIMLVVGGVAGVIDNILRPYLASFGDSKIPPIAAFVFVIGGAYLLGFPGLFIGLLVGSFIFDTLPFFWNDMKEKKKTAEFQNLYIHEVDSSSKHKH